MRLRQCRDGKVDSHRTRQAIVWLQKAEIAVRGA
jgi:hypothetical protein